MYYSKRWRLESSHHHTTDGTKGFWESSTRRIGFENSVALYLAGATLDLLCRGRDSGLPDARCAEPGRSFVFEKRGAHRRRAILPGGLWVLESATFLAHGLAHVDGA